MLAILLILLSATSGLALAAEPAPDLDARRQAFQKLLDEQWEYTLSHSPEFASVLGDKRWNDKLSDLSVEAIVADQAMDREFLKKFDAVDATGFPEDLPLVRELPQTHHFDAVVIALVHRNTDLAALRQLSPILIDLVRGAVEATESISSRNR